MVCKGIWLTGATPFLISTRNSPAAVAHLMSTTNVSAVFVSPDAQMQSLAAAALRKLVQPEGGMGSKIHKFSTPKHDDLFNSLAVTLKPLQLPTSVTLDSPALILHSSGSTAFPKPITITHSVLREWASAPRKPSHSLVNLDTDIYYLVGSGI